MLKRLVDQLMDAKKKYGIELTLDQGLIAMLEAENDLGLNVDLIIEMFRPPARYIQVPITY